MSTGPLQQAESERAVSRSQFVPGNCTTAMRGAPAATPTVYGGPGWTSQEQYDIPKTSKNGHAGLTGTGSSPDSGSGMGLPVGDNDVSDYPVDINGFVRQCAWCRRIADGEGRYRLSAT